MMEFLIAGLIMGAVLGYLVGIGVKAPQSSKPREEREEPSEGYVRRVKPNLRNPMKTRRTAYERYQMKETGLYAPVKPKGGGNDKHEVELGG